MTVSELRSALEALEEQGLGDREVCVKKRLGSMHVDPKTFRTKPMPVDHLDVADTVDLVA